MEQILVNVLSACAPLITAALVWLITKATDWLKAKTDLISVERENAIQNKIVALVEIVTRETAQTYVKEITEKSADGVLTKEEKEQAFKLTFDKSLRLLKDNGIEVGEELLKSVIEAVVNKLKNA